MNGKANKTAIVTGGSGGIGDAICRQLSGDGFNIVLNYNSSQSAGEKVAAGIIAAGGACITVQGSISEPATFRKLFDAAENEFGGADVLVNNAGYNANRFFDIADVEDDLFHRIFDTNVKGTFNGLREAAKRLREGGSVVNLSTSLVVMALPGRAVYAGSKAAIETFTKIMAKELRGRNIRVNCVAPGPVATKMLLDGKSSEEVAELTKMAPLERLGTPEDVAEIVAFLASDASGWINGQTIRANGGVA